MDYGVAAVNSPGGREHLALAQGGRNWKEISDLAIDNLRQPRYDSRTPAVPHT